MGSSLHGKLESSASALPVGGSAGCRGPREAPQEGEGLRATVTSISDTSLEPQATFAWQVNSTKDVTTEQHSSRVVPDQR